MSYRLKTTGLLLNDDGELIEKGYATSLIKTYNRSSIKASKLRIKEWDYYAVLSEEHGIALTIADNGYMGFVSATVFDFVKKKEISNSIMTILPMGKMNLPHTSTKGETVFENKNCKIIFSTKGDERIVDFEWNNFYNGKDLKGLIQLKKSINDDSLVIATPFKENKKAFYYNQKINNLKASGFYVLGEEKKYFGDKKNFGVLDWGRGVWTYKNTWYWGSLSTLHNNKDFGFNIGYGFGDTSKATENIIFYDGKSHKISDVYFNIPPDSFMKPWTFTSNDNRFNMNFQPILDRHSSANFVVLKSNQHQVFGLFTGEIILDDGLKIEIEDELGFAEKVFNKW